MGGGRQKVAAGGTYRSCHQADLQRHGQRGARRARALRKRRMTGRGAGIYLRARERALPLRARQHAAPQGAACFILKRARYTPPFPCARPLGQSCLYSCCFRRFFFDQRSMCRPPSHNPAEYFNDAAGKFHGLPVVPAPDMRSQAANRRTCPSTARLGRIVEID